MTRLLFKTLKVLKYCFKYNVLGTNIIFFHIHCIHCHQVSLSLFSMKVKCVINFSMKFLHCYLREKMQVKSTLKCELLGQLWCNINSILQPAKQRIWYAFCMAPETCSNSRFSGLTLWIHPDYWRN